MTAGAKKAARCAIYTRVSTDAGLYQEFNSLDTQYDAAQAYIRSETHAGWSLIRRRYDDGGFSGGSTDRPALQQLLADIKDHKVDVIVVYKVDRLTRSLADLPSSSSCSTLIRFRYRYSAVQHHHLNGSADPQRPTHVRPV